MKYGFEANQMIVIITFLTVAITAIFRLMYLWAFSNLRKTNLPPHFKVSTLSLISAIFDGSFLAVLFNASKVLGPIYYMNGIRNPFVPTIVCGEIGLAKIILVGDQKSDIPASNKSGFYKLFAEISFGRPSILTKQTDGEGWHWARKGVAPSFSMNNLVSTIAMLNQDLDKLMDHMAILSHTRKPVDITSMMIHFTIDFLTRSMFGESFNAFQDYDKPAECSNLSEGKRFLDELNIATKEYFKVVDPFRRYKFWKPEVRRAKQAMKFLDKFTMDLLQRYRRNHSDEEIKSDTSIMGHLLRSPYPTDKDRQADMIMLLLGGHDTTGCALAWTVLEVAKHPDVLIKIRQELDEVNPDRSVPFDSSHLPKLEYLWNVIREGLRLWPPSVVASSRMVDREVLYNGMCIPKGSYISINNLILMRTGISRPYEFIPERWGEGYGDTNEQNRLLNQFIPFSMGKRNCVGQNMALLELKLVLATLFRRFDFELSSPPIIEIGALVKSENKFKTGDMVKDLLNSGCLIGDQEYEFNLTIKPKNAFLTVHDRI